MNTRSLFVQKRPVYCLKFFVPDLMRPYNDGQIKMKDPDDTTYEVGAFDPLEAKRILGLFEARGISFEIQADHSALGNPMRAVGLYLGMYPAGSKLVIFASETAKPEVERVLAELFPV